MQARWLMTIGLALCALAVTAQAEETFTVDGTRGSSNPVDTGLFFTAGDPLTSTATGLVGWTSGSGNLRDPDGIAPGGTVCDTAGPSYWMPGGCRVALLGKIGGTLFQLGSSFSGPAPDTGVLLLGVNDDFYSDNPGFFEVTIGSPVANDAPSWSAVKALFER